MKIVLLHAGIADSRAWAAQVEALRAAGHEPVAPDLPGFGEEPLVPPTVDHVGFAAEKLGERGAVVGNSFGGRIALELARARPDLVERLVLIAPGSPARRGRRSPRRCSPRKRSSSKPVTSRPPRASRRRCGSRAMRPAPCARSRWQ